MESILAVRAQIKEHYDQSTACEAYFQKHEKEYVAFYTSMYLIQDSTESLIAHRARGFSQSLQANPERGYLHGSLVAYIEFWGVMQALIIQQDSIAELYKIISTKSLTPYYVDGQSTRLPWTRIREFRDECAGHPARSDRHKPLTRIFIGRGLITYEELCYEKWQNGQSSTYPTVSLDNLLVDYVADAAKVLKETLGSMMKRWPDNYRGKRM
jgi:hypothetical protein